MNKWEALTIVGVVFAIFGSLAITGGGNPDPKEMASAGLEECPAGLDTIRTIWVKDCTSYTKLLQERENVRHDR